MSLVVPLTWLRVRGAPTLLVVVGNIAQGQLSLPTPGYFFYTSLPGWFGVTPLHRMASYLL